MKTKTLAFILTALLFPLASQAEEKSSPPTATETTTDTASTDTFELKLKPFTPDNDFSSKEWFHWGGSIVREADDSYLLFYSRWPRKYGFLCWLWYPHHPDATSSHK